MGSEVAPDVCNYNLQMYIYFEIISRILNLTKKKLIVLQFYQRMCILNLKTVFGAR